MNYLGYTIHWDVVREGREVTKDREGIERIVGGCLSWTVLRVV